MPCNALIIIIIFLIFILFIQGTNIYSICREWVAFVQQFILMSGLKHMVFPFLVIFIEHQLRTTKSETILQIHIKEKKGIFKGIRNSFVMFVTNSCFFFNQSSLSRRRVRKLSKESLTSCRQLQYIEECYDLLKTLYKIVPFDNVRDCSVSLVHHLWQVFQKAIAA